jgi:molybdopterin-guanine dinucleotide biosynthesis protein A
MPQEKIRPAAIAGLVLMGGQGTRMGGCDKALIEIAGRPILAHALERLASQLGPVALSANGDPERLARFGVPVLADPPDGPGGPLSGILAGFAWAASLDGVTHLATAPGDDPLPPADLVARLWAAGGGDVAVATGSDGVEPLHALWPLALRPRLDALIAEGVRSPKRALERLAAAPAPFTEDEGAFRDIDTPQDLEAARTRFGGA